MARKKYTFEVKPGAQGTCEFYYSNNEAEDRCIGHLRGDFGSDGTGFWTTWFPHAAADRNDKPFQDEFSSLVKSLRRDVLKNCVFMRKYLRKYDSLALENGIVTSRGYMVVTEQYEYYIRCQPQPGYYNFYIYAYVRERDRKSDGQEKCVFVSVWGGGIEIESQAMFDVETGIVSAIQRVNLLGGPLNGSEDLVKEYVRVGKQTYDLRRNDDYTYSAIRPYEVFFSRNGYAVVHATSADEARKIADEKLKYDDVSWDDDWHPTDVQLEE